MQEFKRSAILVAKVLKTSDAQVAVLEAAGLNGVCTDQQLTVLKAFGDTTAYLKAENFIFDLSELLPDDVGVIVKAAAHRALASNKRVTLSELNFGGVYAVQIAISPFITDDADRQLLVLFTTNKKKPKIGPLSSKLALNNLPGNTWQAWSWN